MRCRVFLFTLLLTACADNRKDYDASARCQGMGYKPGTSAYDRCVEDEKMEKLMQQQRQEFEQLQQERQDQKLKGY